MSKLQARHEVPGIMRKIARPSGTIEPFSFGPLGHRTRLNFSGAHFLEMSKLQAPPGQ